MGEMLTDKFSLSSFPRVENMHGWDGGANGNGPWVTLHTVTHEPLSPAAGDTGLNIASTG